MCFEGFVVEERRGGGVRRCLVSLSGSRPDTMVHRGTPVHEDLYTREIGLGPLRWSFDLGSVVSEEQSCRLSKIASDDTGRGDRVDFQSPPSRPRGLKAEVLCGLAEYA